MANFTNSTSFSAGQTLTAANLDSITSGLALTDIDRDDAAADTSFITIQNTAPSAPKEGEVWFNSIPGTNQGILMYYNGSQWVQIGEGIVGYNATAGTLPEGTVVSLDVAQSALGDGRVPIKEWATGEAPLGVLIVEALASASQPIGTRFFSQTVLKATGTAISKGDPVISSFADPGKVTSGNLNFVGKVYGGACIGTALDDAAAGATLANVLIDIPRYSNQDVTALTSTPTLISTILANQSDTYTNSYSTPAPITLPQFGAHVKAHILRVGVRSFNAGTFTSFLDFRPVGGGQATGNTAFSGQFLGGGTSLLNELTHQIIVPANHNQTLLEFKYNSDPTGATLQVLVYHQGAIFGAV